MTSRERLLCVAEGKSPDRQPAIGWPVATSDSDVVVIADASKVAEVAGDSRAVLVEVCNPFGLALRAGVDLNVAQKSDPESGSAKLSEFVNATRQSIQAALDAGADGIFYKLFGANEKFCTPMQFGGYYLETERELLQGATGAALNVLFIVGDADTFIDFVSDLPAHVFAWDAASTGFSVSAVRELRHGALCTNASDADVLLQTGCGSRSISEFLTLQVNGSHA